MNCRLCKHKRCCKIFKVLLTYEEHILGRYEIESKDKLCIRLKHKQNSRECVYLINSKCSIYKNRPKICREYNCTEDFRVLSKKEMKKQILEQHKKIQTGSK